MGSRKLSSKRYSGLAARFQAMQTDARESRLSAEQYGHLAARFQWKQTVSRNMLREAAKPPVAVPPVAGPGVRAKCVYPTGHAYAGEPVTGVGKDKAVPPVAGSEQIQGDGHTTGTCPLCGAHVKVSSLTGGVSSHTMRLEPTGVLPGMPEPNIAPVDTGSRSGDPESGGKRRAADIDGAFERATVESYDADTLKIIKDDDGNPVMVPGTAENLGVALRAALARATRVRQRKTETGAEFAARVRRHADDVATLRRMRDAAMAGTQGMLDAGPTEGTESVTTDATGRVTASGRRMSPGPAMVQGRDGTPFAGEVVTWRKGETRPEVPDAIDPRNWYDMHAGTLADPSGRSRMDVGASTVPADMMMVGGKPVPKHGGEYGWLTRAEYDTLSRGQQNRYWKTVRKHEAQADAARERVTAWRKREKAWRDGHDTTTGTGTGGMGGKTFVYDGTDRDGYAGVRSDTERIMRQPRS